MKKFLLLIFAATLFPLLPAFAQKDPGKYMETIGKEFDDISADMWDYTNSVAHGKSARKVENRRKEVLGSIKDAQKRIGKMSDFDGDKSLRDSVLSLELITSVSADLSSQERTSKSSIISQQNLIELHFQNIPALS